ncbi:uncharacterized protein LOC124450958 isoform X1 [Xenia sp. Carnegie-2017]|uniref:uncharacterized protein LOC124450958 isoform X1 n=1 Tax=Xenia sp. Carnegie-2017 TaxID=2897299 RepID=UPI001F03DF05|nr:uncharacterized protein LOC124450958 isoform X1 [Xenia sp. Carnegie-2017]
MASANEIDVISELQKKPFSVRQSGEQNILVKQRPIPNLQATTGNRSFQEIWYSKKDRLCGSSEKNALFCWPCLLFCPGSSSSWTQTGFKNMKNFLSDCKKHEKAKSHLGAYKTWKTYGFQPRLDCLVSQARREEIQRHNEEVDEATDVSTKEQLSVIVRMDKGESVIERQLGFVDVSCDRTATAISSVVKGKLSQYNNVKEKFIGQTYDGASVMSGHLNGVQAQVQQDYPYAQFVHYAPHRLNLVLCQTPSPISPVKIFFVNISAFCTFTSNSPREKLYYHPIGLSFLVLVTQDGIIGLMSLMSCILTLRNC